eukprot:CAMPEP_0201917752 /NCGR_PEP_ID=MMETSP0903-20130614/7044_1 /ASSEMBLY_ACC=CAM_ASM_000552 /TAXON_ID=420261 /ORGANISM="Thalassiosira antarctica, Strain CCMP982" /LENGTH=1593 /DNA_ID=CAMNT_0048453865 /DNA_START=41 /DNA_END=4822 /DNA_ORIENTATION=-
MAVTEEIPLGSTTFRSPSLLSKNPELASSRRENSKKSLVLEKLDEVSESNASFLDDISSIDQPNNAVQKFFSEPAPNETLWSSTSTKSPSIIPLDSSGSTNQRRPSSRNSSVLSSKKSSVLSKTSIREDNDPLKATLSAYSTTQPPPAADQQDEYSKSSSSSSTDNEKTIPKSNASSSGSSLHPPKSNSPNNAANLGIQRQNSQRSNCSSSLSHPNKLNGSNSSLISHGPQNSHAASLSSGSYYGGILARAAAMKTSVADPYGSSSSSSASRSTSSSSSSRHDSRLQDQDLASGVSGGGVQDAGIKTIESVRSMSLAPSSSVHEERIHSSSRSVGAGQQHQQLDRVNEESMHVDNPGGQCTQQGSGESPLENTHPNVDDISSMSSVVSRARGSFLGDTLPNSFAASQAIGVDVMSASSKTSDLSDHSREELVGKPTMEQPGVDEQISVSKARVSPSRDLPTTFASQTKGIDAMGASSKISSFSELSREKLVGESMTEQPVFKPNLLPTAFASQTKGMDVMSASSKISSLSGHSQEELVGKSPMEPAFKPDFLPTFASQTKGIDVMSASSKLSGLSEHSREQLVEKSPTEPAIEPELGVDDQISSHVAAGKANELRSSSSRAESAVSAKDNVSHLTPRKKHLDFEKLSMKSGDDMPFGGEDLYEDFPSPVSDEDDMILRTRSSCSSQAPPKNIVETDSRKPWKTAPREGTTSVDLASSIASGSHMDSQENSIKMEPEHVEELQQPVDESSDGSLSESFESKEVLKMMGYYSPVVDPGAEEKSTPDISGDKLPMEETPVTRVHISPSSDDDSSITEWDFSGQARVITGASPTEHDDNANGGGSKSNSSKSGSYHRPMDEEQPELLETSQEDTDASNSKNDDNIDELENDNEKANSSSAIIYAAAANEMTELLKNSMLSRSQQQTQWDELYSDESSSPRESEKSGNSIIESLKSFHKSFQRVEIGERTSSPSVSEEGDVSSEENKFPKGDAELEFPDGNQESRVRPSLISSAVVNASEKESGNDINNMLQSFKKRKSVHLDPDGHSSGDVGTGQSPPLQPDSARRPSHESHSSFIRGYKMLTNSESLETPNPFLDDSSDDEEIGLNVVLPLSIENTNNEGNAQDENNNATPEKMRWYQRGEKCRKSKLCWIALFAIAVVVAVVIGVVVAQSKKEPRGEPSNPSVQPPSNPQTASPTRLPTPLPSINITPNWVQVGGDLVGEEPGDEAGFSVSASENGRVIIGARRNAKDGMKNRGAARIYQFDSKTGFYIPIMDIYGEAAGDQCGFSVSMSKNGKRVAVGSLGSDKNGQNSGQVRIFDENELLNTWTLVSELTGEEETSLFGASVSLSQDGSHLAVGAPYYSEGTDMTRSGRSYVYREAQEADWEQVGGPMYGTSSNDLFGWSVSFSPNAQLVAVGAPRLEGTLDSGYVKVFYFETNAWKMYGGPMSRDVQGDRFGFSVSLAGDDTLQRVAIGAPGTSENGEGSGLASVYEHDGNDWQRSGNDLFGDGWGENLGYAVSMTPGATRMVVGVPNKKLDGVPVGQVQVVDVKPGNLLSAGEMYGRDGEKFGVSVFVSSEGTLVYGGASMANLVRVYGDI